MSRSNQDIVRFSMAVHVESGVPRLRLAGEIDLDALDQLRGLLERVHELALQVGAPEVAVDMRECEFMNSSSIKQFVTWVRIASEGPRANSYKIKFLLNPDLTWQRRSLGALTAFGQGLVRLEGAT